MRANVASGPCSAFSSKLFSGITLRRQPAGAPHSWSFTKHAVHQHDPAAKQPPYPGNRELERRIKSIIRWNAMAMVVRANKQFDGIGGHISTFASAATLYEVASTTSSAAAARAATTAIRSTSRARLAGHVRAGVPRRPLTRAI
jgi:hypothetical protein